MTIFPAQDKTQTDVCMLYFFLRDGKDESSWKPVMCVPCPGNLISMSVTNSEEGHTILYGELLMFPKHNSRMALLILI